MDRERPPTPRVRSVGELSLSRIIERHLDGRHGMVAIAVALLIAASVLLMLALVDPEHRVVWLVPGLWALVVSAVPIAEARERNRRIETLRRLEEQWAVPPQSADAGHERDAILAVLTRLYPRSSPEVA